MTSPQRQEQPDRDNAVRWVEDQLQDTRARLHKLENELDQALKHVWSVDADVRTLTETVSTSGAATVAVEKLREDIRQLTDWMGRVQDRQNEISNRIDEAARQRQSEVGRERQDVAALSKQIETIERNVVKHGTRVQSLEEAVRHTEDEISELRLTGHGLERSLAEMATKVERTEEAANRLGEETARLAAALDRQEREDARASERLALLSEQFRRFSERADKLDELADFPQEVKGLLDRATHEREQLSQRMNIVDKLSTEASDVVKALKQTVALIEQRSNNQLAQLTEMASRLQDLEEQTTADLKKIIKVTLRQRRRQIEALNQEVKELTQGEPKSEG